MNDGNNNVDGKRMNYTAIVMVVLGLSICCISLCIGKDKLKVGDKAPEFLLMDKDGREHALSEFLGKKVALYFYPKDDTPGCTKQACSVRDSFADLSSEGIVVIGLSKGTGKDKINFSEKYHLPFPLFCATEKTLKDYGVNGCLFIKRRTFLIDEKGIIIKVIKNVDTANHAQQILDGFKNI